MTSAELTEWAAFERAYGPLLIHERIDVGLAQLGMIMAKLWSKGDVKFRDFLPGWYDVPRSEDRVKAGFEQMLRTAMATNGGSSSRPSPP